MGGSLSSSNSTESITLSTIAGEAKDLIVAVPLFHILLCALYLMAYYASFGNEIIHFTSALDLFAISLKEIGPSYGAVTLVGGAFFLHAKAKHGHVRIIDRIKAMPEHERPKAEEKFEEDRKWFLFVTWAVILITMAHGAVVWFKTSLFPFSSIAVAG